MRFLPMHRIDGACKWQVVNHDVPSAAPSDICFAKMPRQIDDRKCLRFGGAGVGGRVWCLSGSSSSEARRVLPSSIRGSLATWRAKRFARSWRSRQLKDCIFPRGNTRPIRRTGFLSAASDGFRAQNGRKAMTSMESHGITATFNPLGVFLRRWQLDGVHIHSGEVGIQTYEPKPEPSPSKPWYHVFLPNRVYLRRVWSDPADVTWRFRNEKGGFFGTRLLITPHGRDFEYQAEGGTMKLALIPDLPWRRTHLLLTKKLLTLYTLDLAAGPASDGAIHGEGTAGTGEDKSVDFKVRFDKLPSASGCPRAGRIMSREQLPERSIGAERIRSWRRRWCRVRSGWRTGAFAASRSCRNWRRSPGRNRSKS